MTPEIFLYIHFIRALIQTQPEFFVAENVKGMMTLGRGEVLNQIVADFAAAGYTVTPHLVNARDYGVPQLRERVFLIGVHKEKNRTKNMVFIINYQRLLTVILMKLTYSKKNYLS